MKVVDSRVIFQCIIEIIRGYIMAKKLAVLLVLVTVAVLSVSAYQFSPLNVTFDPSGSGSAKVYTIVNDSDSPIAIEISAVKRNMDMDGNEDNEDASAYFNIQPKKVVIKGQSTQLIRVQYRGPKTVTEEMSFRIISEQIAYSTGAQTETEGQMISFLFVYSTSAYVAPSKVVEKTATSAFINDDGDLEIRIENTGSVHQLLNDLQVTVSSGSTVYQLTDDEMGTIKGANLLCGGTLRIVLPVPEVLKGKTNLSASISYDYTYSAS